MPILLRHRHSARGRARPRDRIPMIPAVLDISRVRPVRPERSWGRRIEVGFVV